MKEITNIRKEIDKIDDELMDLLNKRFQLTKKIGKEKQKNQEEIENFDRENDIISKTYNYSEQKTIEKCFKEIIKISKNQQLLSSYLLIKDSSYTLSPLVHSLLGNDYYQALEINNINDFFNSLDYYYRAVNITNPYKKDAFNYCLNNNIELDEYALKTNIINLITNNNKLKAYNTDYSGFKYLINNNNINLDNKNIVLLGNGDTAKTIKKVLEEFNCKNIYSIVRTKRSENEILFKNAYNLKDIDIIINATSFGVMPNLTTSSLLDVNRIKPEIIIDVNYNPFRGNLSLNNNCKYINGLDMLIEQARISEEIIQNKKIDISNNNNIKKEIYKQTLNLCFIGMPFSGKTTIANTLGAKHKKIVFDSDIILKEENLSLSKLLSLGLSEKDYREYEKNVIETLATLSSSIISTGGGVILDADNINLLKQKGLIIFIDTPLEILKMRLSNDRPLIKNIFDLEKLYHQRYDLYKKYSDIILDGSKTIKQIILELEEKLNEYFNN